MAGSSGILLILLGLFFLLSFVTGRLDWLKRLNQSARDLGTPAVLTPGAVGGTTAPFGPTGVAPTTAGRVA